MRRLDGLYRFMPITGTLAIVAGAAMAGVPLLNGFLSKEMFFAETVFVSAHPAVEYGLPALATLAGVFAVVYSLRFGHDVFFGPPPTDLPRPPHEPVHWMRVPVELLVLACVVVGTMPAWSIGPLLATAARPVVGGALPDYSLAVWHGFNAPLMMSLLATAGGLLLYLRFAPAFKRRARRSAPGLLGLDGRRVFEGLLAWLSALSRRLARALGTRRLQPQLLWMVLIAGLAGLASALIVPLSWGDRERVPIAPAFALLWLIGAACAIGAAWQAKFHRLAALTMLGAVGLVLCITFAWFSAPDLALTQLAVEVVTMVLFLLGLRWMPKRVEPDDPRIAPRAWWRRRRDLVLAVLLGAGLAALSYALQTRLAPMSISPTSWSTRCQWAAAATWSTWMLVDFRAFDTLGEITVLGIVGISVYALLRRFRPPRGRWRCPSSNAWRPSWRAATWRTARSRSTGCRPTWRCPRCWCGCCCRWRRCSPSICSCAATTSPAGLRRRPGGGHRLHRAVHGGRHALGRGAHAPAAAALDRLRLAGVAAHRPGGAGARLPLPDHAHRTCALAAGRRGASAHGGDLRPGRVRGGGGRGAADADGDRAPVASRAAPRRRRRRGGGRLMELIIALAIGVMAGPACGCCCGRAASRC